MFTENRVLTRREALAAALAGPALCAQSQLPLRSTGLEHVGFTTPDPQKSASFYGRIFDPQIFQEMNPPLRFYCRLGTGYVAFGPGANVPARIDHYCALVEKYRLEDMRAELRSAGLNLTGQAGYNSLPDPDGIRLQLIDTPAGLAKSIIPSTRVTQDDAVCEAIGLDHIMLAVTDLERSAEFYRRFFGKETSREKNRVWLTVARTRLGLEKVAAGQMPRIDHFAVRIAGFDRRAVTDKLKKMSVEILSPNDENLLRIKDSDGFTVELRGA